MLANVVPRRWQRAGFTSWLEALAGIECNGMMVAVSDLQ
jgi:hypothetical protein